MDKVLSLSQVYFQVFKQLPYDEEGVISIDDITELINRLLNIPKWY